MDPDPCQHARQILKGLPGVGDDSIGRVKAKDSGESSALSVVQVLDEVRHIFQASHRELKKKLGVEFSLLSPCPMEGMLGCPSSPLCHIWGPAFQVLAHWSPHSRPPIHHLCRRRRRTARHTGWAYRDRKVHPV